MCTLYIQLPLGVVGNVLVGAVGAELQLQLQSCDGEAVVGGGLVNSMVAVKRRHTHGARWRCPRTVANTQLLLSICPKSASQVAETDGNRNGYDENSLCRNLPTPQGGAKRN